MSQNKIFKLLNIMFYITQAIVFIVILLSPLKVVFKILLSLLVSTSIITSYFIHNYFLKQIYLNNQNNEKLIKASRIIVQKKDNPIYILTSEIEKLRKELENKENQINFMSSFTQQGLLLIDHTKNIIYSNQLGEELLHLVETKFTNYIVKIRYADIKAQIDKTFNENRLITREYKIGNKSLSIKTTPTTSKGQINVLLVADDLSEKIGLQNTKKDFFNFAGHELKTPLTVLKGYAELIEHKIVTGQEVYEVAGKIIDQATIMTDFVEDMLMLSRLESFKDAPVIEINLKEKLDNVLSLYKEKINEKNILVRTFIEDVTYYGDPLDLDKMFKNLVENAVNYNYENGTIDIRLSKQDYRPIFEIQNTGIAIPLNEVDRIFERFYRISETRNIPGTGLGLSIVKHIVNKYHGSIKVESVPKKHVKFTVLL